MLLIADNNQLGLATRKNVLVEWTLYKGCKNNQHWDFTPSHVAVAKNKLNYKKYVSYDH
jgi:hypothetical protein